MGALFDDSARNEIARKASAPARAAMEMHPFDKSILRYVGRCGAVRRGAARCGVMRRGAQHPMHTVHRMHVMHATSGRPSICCRLGANRSTQTCSTMRSCVAYHPLRRRLSERHWPCTHEYTSRMRGFWLLFCGAYDLGLLPLELPECR